MIERLFVSPDVQHLAFTFIGIMIAISLMCFIVSEITGNYSQVDKLWSLIPVAYGIISAVRVSSPRLMIMLVLVVFWGLRLSYNFYRKGGYNILPWKGEEDYRWRIIRETPMLKGRLRFGLFNLLFISFYQNFLIMLFCTPYLIAAENNNSALNRIDAAAAVFMILSILIETIADNQLFRFQSMKKAGISSEGNYPESLKAGFMSEGIWRYVRHPNYLGEQATWISFYLFSVAASGKWLNWSIAGAILLVLLFYGSSTLTEKISSAKYPSYAEYRKRAGRYFPRL
jgi:steroid 5-alpha reductase family enzyme